MFAFFWILGLVISALIMYSVVEHTRKTKWTMLSRQDVYGYPPAIFIFALIVLLWPIGLPAFFIGWTVGTMI